MNLWLVGDPNVPQAGIFRGQKQSYSVCATFARGWRLRGGQDGARPSEIATRHKRTSGREKLQPLRATKQHMAALVSE